MTRWAASLGLLLAVTPAGADVCSPAAVARRGAATSTAKAPARSAAAHAEFVRGVQMFRDGDATGAAAAFACAYELSADYRLLYNLAQVEAERENYAAALSLLGRYLDHGGSRIDAARRAEVARERSRLSLRSAALRVGTSARGAVLWVDGVYSGELPSGSVWLDPGEHHLLIEAPGHAPARRSVTLLPGDRQLLAVPLKAAPSAPTPARAVERAPSSARTPLWISLGAAGASGGLALAFSMLARSADAKLERELRRYPADPAQVGAARSRLRTLSAVSDVSLGAGAVAASVSLYLALRGSPAAPATGEARSVRIAPLGLGLALRGSF